MAKLIKSKDLKGFVVHVDHSAGQCLSEYDNFTWDIDRILVFKTKTEASSALNRCKEYPQLYSIVPVSTVFGFEYSLYKGKIKKEVVRFRFKSSLKDLLKWVEEDARDYIDATDHDIKQLEAEIKSMKKEKAIALKELAKNRQIVRNAMKAKL